MKEIQKWLWMGVGLIISGLVLFFLTSTFSASSTMLNEEPLKEVALPPPAEKNRRSLDRIRYILTSEQHTIGYAYVLIDDSYKNPPQSLELHFVSRVGKEPMVLSFFEEQMIKDDKTTEALYSGKVSVQAAQRKEDLFQYQWTLNSSHSKVAGFQSDVIRNLLLGSPFFLENVKGDKISTWSKESAHLFYRPQSQVNVPSTVVTFLGDVRAVPVKDADYAVDGVLNRAVLNLGNDLPAITVQRADDKVFDLALTSLKKKYIPLAWLSSPSTLKNDLLRLHRNSDQCLHESRELELKVSRRLPELPYLAHRKLLNLQKMCRNLAASLDHHHSRKENPELVFPQIAKIVQNISQQDKREIPTTFLQHPGFTVLQDLEQSMFWPKAAMEVLTATVRELQSLIDLEEVQKERVSLRVYAKDLDLRSVIKGNLRLKSEQSPIKVVAPSWKAAAEWQVISGVDYAKGVKDNLFEKVCSQNDGNAVLDWTKGEEALVVRSKVWHGPLDDNVKSLVSRRFALDVLGSGYCQNIFIRVLPTQLNAFDSEMRTFEREVLQTQSTFQFSNGSVKKMRLIPGTYEFVASSVVSGSVVGKEVIEVSKSRNRRKIESLRIVLR